MSKLKPHKSPEEIAKKHRLNVSLINQQLQMGIPIEHEHTQNKELATYIALQHLDEIPDYYTRLKKMESSAKKEHGKFKDAKVNEDLRKWFSKSDPEGNWRRFNTKGEAIGPCARKPGEPKPKCLSNEKSQSMSKSQIATAVKRKRKEDPVANRSGKGESPVLVSNKIKEENSIGEIRFCQLCGKKEYKMECNYGPDMWDKFSISRTHPTNEEKDHEYSIARSELSTIMNAAKRLKTKMGKGEGNVEAWVQSKITKAADYLDSAADYIDSGESKVDEACWVGYKKVGMKKKGKKMVPNCVPVKEGIVRKILDQLQGEEELEYFEEENKPTNPSLWSKAKSLAKQKFDVYPSAYANGWASKWYKSKGGGWKSVSEDVEIEESTYMPSRNGQVISVVISWRGLSYVIKMFFPQPRIPSRREVSDQIEKVYPGGKVLMFKVSTIQPGEPIVQVTEEIVNEVAAWQRKEGKNPEGGLNKKGIESYRRENPGSHLSLAVTTPPSKLDPDSKPAKRRKSFCARMGGMPGPMKDEKGRPTRKALSLRKWNC